MVAATNREAGGSLTQGTEPARQVRREMINDPDYGQSLPWRTGAGEVGDVMFRRMDDPILLVQIDHGRLDIRMAQHGLNLSDGGAMFQRERRGRMTQRMGRDRPQALGLGMEQPSKAGLLQMLAHHGLNRPDAQSTAAATLSDI